MQRKMLFIYRLAKKYLKQYVGPTFDIFQHLWNKYKSNDRKCQRSEPCMQEHLIWHFSSPVRNGFLNETSITFIYKIDPSDPLKRENVWRETLMIMVPYGLNIEDRV